MGDKVERRQYFLRSSSLLKTLTTSMETVLGGANGLVLKRDDPKEKEKDNRILAGLDLQLSRKDLFAHYIHTLPKYLHSVKLVHVDKDDPRISIMGPEEEGQVTQEKPKFNPFFPEIFAKSISTYPHFPGNEKQEGSPICDRYAVQASSSGTICALADGCGWGERARGAADRAINTFIKYLSTRISKIKEVRHAGELLLKAFREAHIGIMQHVHTHEISEQCPQCVECGTTTMLGGILLPLETHAHEGGGQPKWGFVCCSVGDCKVFCVHQRKVTEVTNGSRYGSTDASDCGGRLGPQMDFGLPDLRNLQLFFHPCYENDVLLVVTDGVHDNLDPEHLGKSTTELGLNATSWTAAPRTEVMEAKDLFRIRFLEDMLKGEKDPEKVVNLLLEHCQTTTAKARSWMEENKARLPHDYLKYPGKMDHTTCLAVKVPLLIRPVQDEDPPIFISSPKSPRAGSFS